MYYEDEKLIMDEGTSIQSEVTFITLINPRLCIIEDSDGDQWEVDIDRLSSLNPITVSYTHLTLPTIYSV